MTKRELIEALQSLDAPDDAVVRLYDTEECRFVPVLSATLEKNRAMENLVVVLWADD